MSAHDLQPSNRPSNQSASSPLLFMLRLSQFVSKRSLNLFTALKLDCSFLSTDPNVWDARDDFKVAKQTVMALRVVNDCAEHAVKPATDYNMALTGNEEQRQLIFQVVEYHRKQITAPAKRKFTEI